jgi:hypothetical protein
MLPFLYQAGIVVQALLEQRAANALHVQASYFEVDTDTGFVKRAVEEPRHRPEAGGQVNPGRNRRLRRKGTRSVPSHKSGISDLASGRSRI